MKIAVDVMGSDKDPVELTKGAVAAAEKGGFQIVLFGDEKIIKDDLSTLKYAADVEVVHADETITMCDKATSVIKEKKTSSMAMALSAVAEGKCDAVVSSGNSGALITGATFIVKRAKGVKRPAFAPVIPSATGPVIIVDSGANVECRPEFLAQFGKMGAVYMEKVMGFENPSVGLLSNGSEDSKGTDITREAKALLEKSDCNFIAYIEGNDIMTGKRRVVVCDGFTGNVALKTIEGMGKFVSARVKNLLTGNPIRTIGTLFMIRGIKKFKKEFDSKQYGGAMILGVRAPVVKAHGSADGAAFGVAVAQAAKVAENNVCGTIASAFETVQE